MRQDTGSAIVGPARADLYFGTGNDAGQVAERIRQDGRFTIFEWSPCEETVRAHRIEALLL